VKAARIHSFGDGVRLDDIEEPAAGPGEVTVALRGVALNPLDLWVAEGSVANGSQPLPFVLGTEGVGTVDGRRVIVNGGGIGTERDGLLREFAAVSAELLVDVPASVDDAQAAALSVVGITAKRIFDVAAPEPGAVVVVLGASGGAGSVAVQVGKLLGTRVVAVTGSPEKREWVEELGADLVVAEPDEAVAPALEQTFGRLADVVLNPLGGDHVGAAIDMLVPGGRQVLFGRSAGDKAAFSAAGLYRKNISIHGFGGLADDPNLKDEARTWVLEEIAAGRLEIPVAAEYPLAAANEALDAVGRREVAGKVVVRIDEG
jgi:NADPH2:quinone reductase